MRLADLSKKPLISIVTTCFNSGKYLEECIQSVLGQDYLKVEHIIRDGASTDNTLNLLKKYSQPKYQKRIKIFSEPDNGQSDGLNKAIRKAKGEIILILNADDQLMPTAVSWGIENLEKNPEAGAVYGDTYFINEQSEIIGLYAAHEYDFEKLICVEVVPPAQASFIRRSALEKVGFWVDKTLDTCPDYEMWVRLIQKFPIKHVFGVITKYRKYSSPQLDSKSKRTVGRFVAAKRQVMDRLFNSSKTSQKIKRLKRRAYSSLDYWAAQTAFEMGDWKAGYFYLCRSFVRLSSFKKFMRVYNTSLMLMRFAINKLLKV